MKLYIKSTDFGENNKLDQFIGKDLFLLVYDLQKPNPHDCCFIKILDKHIDDSKFRKGTYVYDCKKVSTKDLLWNNKIVLTDAHVYSDCLYPYPSLGFPDHWQYYTLEELEGMVEQHKIPSVVR